MSTVASFFKRHGRTIIEIITIVGVLLAFLQYTLQQKQFIMEQRQLVSEQQQQPNIEYSYDLVFSDVDQQLITQYSHQLVEDYYKRLFDISQTISTTNYIQESQSILPITATIPAKSASVSIRIHNGGLTTGTNVRAVIEMDRPINDVDVKTRELYEIVRGEIGEKSLTIEIDRIVANDTVTIQIRSDNTDTLSQQDQIVLSNDSSIQYKYDAQGNIIQVTDADNNQTVYSYDDSNRLIRIKDPFGNETAFTYDQNGNLVSITSPNDNSTHYTYDTANELMIVTDSSGMKTQYAYDQNGNRLNIPIGGSSKGNTFWDSSDNLFPKIRYIPAEQPFFDVSVTSYEDGEATFITKYR